MSDRGTHSMPYIISLLFGGYDIKLSVASTSYSESSLLGTYIELISVIDSVHATAGYSSLWENDELRLQKVTKRMEEPATSNGLV